jgi:hypothetical protein
MRMGVMRKLPVVPICRNPTALPLHPNQRQISRYPVLTKRGVSRSSRTLGAGCGGRFGDARRATLTRTAKSCGPDAPTLASSLRVRSQATVAKEPGHRGEHEISSKTIARGRPGELAEPVVTTLVCFVLFCTRGCGCGHASGFPCALCFEREVGRNLGRFAPRECGVVSEAFEHAKPPVVIVRESGRSSIPETSMMNREAAAYWIPRLRGV